MMSLLIRPQHKLAESSKNFQKAGLDIATLALIKTVAYDDNVEKLKQVLTLADNGGVAIFVSTVAAELACAALARTESSQWPSHLQCVAVGPSTAQILLNCGARPVVPSSATTEGLLSMPTLTEVTDKHCYIMKGNGGRVDLAQGLIKRGAVVTELELYKRCQIESPLENTHWQQDQIRCIIVTSGEQIELAFNKLDNQWLKQTPWIVVSERTAEIAAKLGVQQILISTGATDTELIATAKKLLER